MKDRASDVRGDSDMRDGPGTALRKKLLRRLIWKAPLIFLLMFFAVWRQVRTERGTQPSSSAGSKAALFTGRWNGEVIYPWGDKYSEEFLFQPEGDKLFGTASFLGMKRGMRTPKSTEIRFRFLHSSINVRVSKRYSIRTITGGKLSIAKFQCACRIPGATHRWILF